ncbi:MAG: DUF2750 domain-containing protein [Thermofilaceae archaeon]|jgi:hypothetical protein|nr:MAG: hypothetical protein KatS3mg021_1830 [Fimbriimonadales bacterium]CUU02801.1 Protein of unknown function (DUF2750) [Armatimonadetes bacterium GBS]CUU35380.1 Protein of unknown function (DUF2750) [Armatimonadetes bacterium GXS]
MGNDWKFWVKKRRAWAMPDQEFHAVMQLPKATRYSYFVKRVADWRYLWGLYSEEEDRWCVAGCSAEEQIVFPLWPHPRYAQAMAVDNWAGARPEPIPLSEWLAEDLPEWEQQSWLVGVFLVNQDDSGLDGIVVPPRKLAEDIAGELMRYEDFGKFERILKRVGLLE